MLGELLIAKDATLCLAQDLRQTLLLRTQHKGAVVPALNELIRTVNTRLP